MEDYKQITLKNKEKWNNSLYFKFLQNANKKELLKSLTQFYLVFDGFNYLLSKLINVVDEKDKKEIENLKKNILFNSDIFKNNLDNFNIFWHLNLNKNPFIKNYTKILYKNDYFSSLETIGSYLSGLEHIYSCILNDIHHFMMFSLDNNVDTTNYDVNSQNILPNFILNKGYQINEVFFNKAQIDLITLFSKITFPTEKELTEISKTENNICNFQQDILFSNLIYMLKNQNKLNILITGDNIESLFELSGVAEKNQKLNFNIFTTDKDKIEIYENKYFQQQEILDNKFNHLFIMFRNIFLDKSMNEIADKRDYLTKNKETFDYVYWMVFNKKNMDILFNKESHHYINKYFLINFETAFNKSFLNPKIENNNKFFYKSPFDFKHLKNYSFSFKSESINEYFKKDINNQLYDIIYLPDFKNNISLEEYNTLILNAYKSLNKDGILVVKETKNSEIFKDVLSYLGYKDGDKKRHICKFPDIKEYYFLSKNINIFR